MADHDSTTPRPHSEADISEQMAHIDGVNGAAGHRLEDAYLRELVHRQLAGEITGDQARELGRKYLAGEHLAGEQAGSTAQPPAAE